MKYYQKLSILEIDDLIKKRYFYKKISLFLSFLFIVLIICLWQTGYAPLITLLLLCSMVFLLNMINEMRLLNFEKSVREKFINEN